MTPDQVHAFVGSKADYYLKRWERIEEHGSPAVGFNWAAFFMQEFWLLYRGMYRWFWIAVAVLLGWMMALEGIVFLAASGSLKRTPWIFLVLLVLVAFRLMPLVFAVLFGVFGTYWYYLHARRQVERTTTGGEPDLQAIARAGGTNWWAPLVAFGVLLGVLTITGCVLAA